MKYFIQPCSIVHRGYQSIHIKATIRATLFNTHTLTYCNSHRQMLDQDKKSLQRTLEQISEDKTLLRPVSFSDEGAFYVFGKVNKHNVRKYGDQKTPRLNGVNKKLKTANTNSKSLIKSSFNRLCN